MHLRACDVAGDKAREELAALVADRFPELNVLADNAGVQPLLRQPDACASSFVPAPRHA